MFSGLCFDRGSALQRKMESPGPSHEDSIGSITTRVGKLLIIMGQGFNLT